MTKGKGCGIILRLSRESEIAEWSLKIEQQEISTKQKQSANLVKELYILNKVKEAKKE